MVYVTPEGSKKLSKPGIHFYPVEDTNSYGFRLIFYTFSKTYKITYRTNSKNQTFFDWVKFDTAIMKDLYQELKK